VPDNNELFVYRKPTTDIDCPGIFVFDNEIICQSLEDPDRDLCNSMPLKEIQEKKIHGVTAIPYGKYPIVWYDSPKHGRVILLKNVKGFSYIEIHPANWAWQLQGCIAPGMRAGTNTIHDSRIAHKKLKLLVIDNDIKFINVLKQK